MHYFRDTMRSLQIIIQCMLRYNPLKAFLALSLGSLPPMILFLLLAILRPEYLLGSAMFGAVGLLTLGMGMLAYAAGRQVSSPIDAGIYAWPDVRESQESNKSRAA